MPHDSASPSEPARCPNCGASLPEHAPQGLCPKCLFAGLAAPTDDGGASASHASFQKPEELAPHFPQLEILECLGRGGMGVVYKARQKSLNRCVALKLLAPERVTDAKFAERFTHEAQALAALNHPNIVTIHDFGQAGGFYFLLMEFVDGVNLRQAMKAGRFTPEQALAVVPPVCEALQYAHDHGIVHRDIKPENLLMDKEGRVKIADFGIAKLVGARTSESHTSHTSHQSHSSDPTQSGVALGTPTYMAPEQRDTPAEVDHRADIYSLGVVLYELLTGKLPADKFQPPSSRLHGMQVDVRLDEIVLRALEKQPELRYQTAGDFRTQLQTLVHASPHERNSSPGAARRLRLAPGLVFVLLYAVVACFVAGSTSFLPERMATHFDAAGNANGWATRSGYFLGIGFLPLLLVGIFWLVSQCANRFPGLLNIPRRDYWLAPERRADTAALLFRRFLWLACALTVFIGALHTLVVQANHLNPPRLSSELVVGGLIVFFVVLIIWIVTFITRLAEAGDYRTEKPAPGATESSKRTRWMIIASYCIVVSGSLFLGWGFLQLSGGLKAAQNAAGLREIAEGSRLYFQEYGKWPVKIEDLMPRNNFRGIAFLGPRGIEMADGMRSHDLRYEPPAQIDGTGFVGIPGPDLKYAEGDRYFFNQQGVRDAFTFPARP